MEGMLAVVLAAVAATDRICRGVGITTKHQQEARRIGLALTAV
jgi:hypothetical protein